MKNNWILSSALAAILTFGITYWLTHSAMVAAISAIVVFIILLIHNPETRYMMAFYVVISPMLSNLVFTIKAKTTHIDIQAALTKTDWYTTIVLFVLAVLCLLLDYLERNGVFTKKKDEKIFIELIKKPYQEQIDQLKAQLKDKEKIEEFLFEKIAELEKARDRQVEEAKELFKKFKEKDISKIYKKAFRYFMQGKLEEALSVLDEVKIQTVEKSTLQDIKKAAETRMLKAQLLRVANRFKEAGENYEKALSLIFDWSHCLKAANYFYFLHDFDKAERYYQLCLLHASNKKERASTLNSLANLHRAKNEFEQAEQEYNEALAIYRALETTNRKSYLPDIATILNNLAILHRIKNEFQKAEQEYKEALDIRRTLAITNSQTYLPYVATTLNNLAILHQQKHNFSKAEEEYKEALIAYRELAKNNSKTYLPDVAQSLNNLANLYCDKKEFLKSEEAYREALKIYRALATTNSQTYLSDIAGTLNNLANLHRDKKEFPKAKEKYQEALEIYRSLATTHQKTYLPYVAMALNNLGIVHRTEKEFPKAEKKYQEALEIFKAFAKSHPQVYQPYVAQTLINMSIFYQENKVNKELSIQLADEAISILLPLANIPYIQKYLGTAALVLKNWGVDIEKYTPQSKTRHPKP